MTLSHLIDDPTTTPARPDLASLALEGLVRADAYAAPRPMRAGAPVIDLFDGSGAEAVRIDQLLFGEVFDVLETRGERAWGQARRDGVVGWVDLSLLQGLGEAPTHRVRVVGGRLPLNALVTVTDGAAPEDLAALGEFEADPIAVAESLIGTPHAVGARSSAATDCAGLVQQALLACGKAGPRYAHQQAWLGRAVAREDIRRGDLAIWLHDRGGAGWSGHSAFVLDAGTILHASGGLGRVEVEPLAAADARCRAEGFSPPAFRRLSRAA